MAKQDFTKARLMLGNEAIARGAVEMGLRLAACYPGTPSSEIVEALLRLKSRGELCQPDMDIEYSVNEKVALEIAAGAALAGWPAMASMKHVGLNVAADPLLTSAYIGMPGGLVIVSADDPGCHSSQNEQDNRYYARLASLPCLEPASAQEALTMTRFAFEISRKLEQPVLLRTTTRVNHMRGPVFPQECSPLGRADFDLAPTRFVPVPAVARGRHKALEQQMAKAAFVSDESAFNFVNFAVDSRMGIIASGVSRSYVADALRQNGWEDRVAVFELGMTWPLPEGKLRRFLAQCDEVLIVEEGEPLLERDLQRLATDFPVRVSGKDSRLTVQGEYSARAVGKRIGDWLGLKPKSDAVAPGRSLPGRSPNLCPGCAHRSVYYAVRKVFGDDAVYSNDIGCYALGLLPPLSAAHFMICMGSSITAGSGYARASGKTVVGYIGDSTFFHSGITGLANAVFNRHNLLLVILDNGTTAMTGHQPNPAMADHVLGDSATHLDIEQILSGLGIEQKITVKSGNLRAVMAALERLRPLPGVRVLIAREPCMLYARRSLGHKRTHVAEVRRQSEAVRNCFAELACPAFTRRKGELAINADICTGCMFCLQIAPGDFGSKKVNSPN